MPPRSLSRAFIGVRPAPLNVHGITSTTATAAINSGTWLSVIPTRSFTKRTPNPPPPSPPSSEKVFVSYKLHVYIYTYLIVFYLYISIIKEGNEY